MVPRLSDPDGIPVGVRKADIAGWWKKPSVRETTSAGNSAWRTVGIATPHLGSEYPIVRAFSVERSIPTDLSPVNRSTSQANIVKPDPHDKRIYGHWFAGVLGQPIEASIMHAAIERDVAVWQEVLSRYSLACLSLVLR
jgi:hypothetical protein